MTSNERVDPVQIIRCATMFNMDLCKPLNLNLLRVFFVNPIDHLFLDKLLSPVTKAPSKMKAQNSGKYRQIT